MVKQHATITDEMLEKSRSRIGVEYHLRKPFFNTQATKDTIRHFALGIGDTNPLWIDEEYAKNTRHGCILAPPCFLYSVYWATGRGSGFAGIHGWHSGNDWHFYRPIRVGDEFTVTNVVTDIAEKKKSEMAGRTFISYADTYYRSQNGELVAKATGWTVWAERAASGERGKYMNIPKATYTPEQLKGIYDAYDSEEVRGANPRYWDDVAIGEELTPVVKGPLREGDIIAFLMGAGSLYIRAHRVALDFERRHPAIGMIDSATGSVDVPELVHMQQTSAQEIGIATAYDYGPQRISWLGHLMTNWVGDDGFLRRLRVELRRFNMVGDTTWCKGRVSRKYIEDDAHVVDCEIRAENQRGEVTASGLATVALPSRAIS